MAKDVFHFSNEYGIHGCRGTVYSMKEKIETETDTKTKLKKKKKNKVKQKKNNNTKTLFLGKRFKLFIH